MLRGNLRRGLALVRRRSPKGPPLAVRLYESPGCGLCGEAHRSLTRIGLDRPLVIERIDIGGDPGLQSLALRIPVIQVAEETLDVAGMQDAAIARWLAVIAPL